MAKQKFCLAAMSSDESSEPASLRVIDDGCILKIQVLKTLRESKLVSNQQ